MTVNRKRSIIDSYHLIFSRSLVRGKLHLQATKSKEIRNHYIEDSDIEQIIDKKFNPHFWLSTKLVALFSCSSMKTMTLNGNRSIIWPVTTSSSQDVISRSLVRSITSHVLTHCQQISTLSQYILVVRFKVLRLTPTCFGICLVYMHM